jgi:hypothetical protein
MWMWESGEYPVWFKERTLAWYGLHVLVAVHQEDAVNKASERKLKQRRKS